MLRTFYKNLIIDKFPNHVIYFRKQEVSNIKGILIMNNLSGLDLSCSSIDLSKLKRLSNIKISSYHMEVSKTSLLIVFF